MVAVFLRRMNIINSNITPKVIDKNAFKLRKVLTFSKHGHLGVLKQHKATSRNVSKRMPEDKMTTTSTCCLLFLNI